MPSSRGGLPNPGIELTSPALTGRFFTAEPPGEPLAFLITKYLLSRGFARNALMTVERDAIWTSGYNKF